MRRRLFWKILLAFWLTFLAITQGVWLLFELKHNSLDPPEGMMMEQMAPLILQGASKALATEGQPGFEAFVASLPVDQRERVDLIAGDQYAATQGGGEPFRFVTYEASDPAGGDYVIRYRYGRPPGPIIPFNTPPDLLALGFIGGLLFSVALAWYLTAPIHRLRVGLDKLAQGDFGVRVAPLIGKRRDEIADLGRDFDLMAQKLEQLVAARDRLLHDVSHELRSPLARLQMAIGLARQSPSRVEASLERIECEADRLDTLVGELLTLARAENDQSFGEDYFDLADVVTSVAGDARFEAEAGTVEIAVHEDIPPEDRRLPIRGDAELARRAIDNVVRNALRFSGAGQRIDIHIGYCEARQSYRVSVTDQGPGVTEEEMAVLFDPFVRGNDGGAGMGLGLTIASRAVIAHGGRIEAERPPQGGLVITMTFPAAKDSPPHAGQAEAEGRDSL